jgi:hypothetical protein
MFRKIFILIVNLYDYMNKKGFVDIIIVLGILIVTVAGSIMVFDNYHTNYIGNYETKALYDINQCPKINEEITKDNLRTFNSLEKAQYEGYNLIEGCGE